MTTKGVISNWWVPQAIPLATTVAVIPASAGMTGVVGTLICEEEWLKHGSQHVTHCYEIDPRRPIFIDMIHIARLQ